MVSCTKLYKAFSGFWETVFTKRYELQKVKLTNLLTYLSHIFLMKFFGILGCKTTPKWTDKLFAQKSLSNCFVYTYKFTRRWWKALGPVGAFLEVISNLFEVKNPQNLLQLFRGTGFAISFWLINQTVYRLAFFGCNFICVLGLK